MDRVDVDQRARKLKSVHGAANSRITNLSRASKRETILGPRYRHGAGQEKWNEQTSYGKMAGFWPVLAGYRRRALTQAETQPLSGTPPRGRIWQGLRQIFSPPAELSAPFTYSVRPVCTIFGLPDR